MPRVTPSGSSDLQADLASIGMAVRVTLIIEATVVSFTTALPALTGLPQMQTVTTHQETKRVVVTVLD